MRFCRICFAPIIATCDRSKPSEEVEWLGTSWLKTKPQFIAMFPEAEKQSDLCFYHKNFKQDALQRS